MRGLSEESGVDVEGERERDQKVENVEPWFRWSLDVMARCAMVMYAWADRATNVPVMNDALDGPHTAC